jgi:hypothetical protein
MKRLFSYLGAALALMLLVVSPVSAATTSSGLSINPRKNLNIQPGSSVTDKLTISNLDQKNDLNITFKVIDFTFTDETGTPKLFIADNAPQTTWSLKPFMTLPKTIVIPAHQSRTVNYSVKIPQGQGAGSYYSAIQYQATGANGGNVSLSASGVTLVFVSVPGIVNEKMELKKLGAYQSGPAGVGGKFVYIAMDKPQQIGYSLKNTGNVAESPVGSMTLKPMFGKKIKTIENINSISSLALLGQTRLFLTCIETEQEQVKFSEGTATSTKCKPPSLIPGRYTVTLDAFYGQNGNNTHEITKTAHFWYLPIWFLLTVLGVILFIAYWAWKLKRRLNRATGSGGYRRTVQRRR